MAKYIVTFRLADSPTYNDRYQKLDDFFEQNTSDIFFDETTSTLFCKGENLATKLADANILINSDKILFLMVNDANKIINAYSVSGSTKTKADDILNFLINSFILGIVLLKVQKEPVKTNPIFLCSNSKIYKTSFHSTFIYYMRQKNF